MRRFWLCLLSLFLVSCDLLENDPYARYGVDRADSLILIGGQPLTLDPALTYSGPDSPLGHVFGGLVSLDVNLQIQPDLAAGWEVEENGRLYTFYLRKHAVFHDGKPVTAQDVLFSWQRAAHPDTESDTVATYLGDIEGLLAFHDGQAEQISGVQVIDDHTLQVRLTEPSITFLAKLAYPVAYIVDAQNVAQPDWQYSPNGTGPFRLEAWEDDEIIVLERNPLYHHALPQLAHVVYRLGADLPLALYETDEIDMVGIGGNTLTRVQDPNNAMNADLRTTVSLCTASLVLNNHRPPFDDPRVRLAFLLGVDRSQLLETFSPYTALKADTLLPPGMPGYVPNETPLPFDPAWARSLMLEAGYDESNFPVLTFTTSGYGEVGSYVTAVITYWQQNLGVIIEPEVVDPFLHLQRLYDGEGGHIYVSSWCADYPDPQNFLEVLYGSESKQNLSGFADDAVDDLLAQARSEPDIEKRLALYQQAEARLLSLTPVIPMSHSLRAILVKPRVQGYELTPFGVAQWRTVSLQEQ